MSRQAALAQIDAVASKVLRSRLMDAIQAFFQSYPARSEEDIARRASLFADDVVFEDPVGSAPILGKAALRKFFQDAYESGWTIHMASQRIVVCGQEAVSLTNASWGLPGEKPAQVEVIHTFAFNDHGRIRSLRVYFDQGTIQ